MSGWEGGGWAMKVGGRERKRESEIGGGKENAFMSCIATSAKTLV